MRHMSLCIVYVHPTAKHTAASIMTPRWVLVGSGAEILHHTMKNAQLSCVFFYIIKPIHITHLHSDTVTHIDQTVEQHWLYHSLIVTFPECHLNCWSVIKGSEGHYYFSTPILWSAGWNTVHNLLAACEMLH